MSLEGRRAFPGSSSLRPVMCGGLAGEVEDKANTQAGSDSTPRCSNEGPSQALTFSRWRAELTVGGPTRAA